MNNKFNINNLIRENVRNIKPYSSARDEYQSTGTSMVFLDANENPFDTDVNRYPDPQQKSLKQELAVLKGVEPNNILLGNGSDEVLDLLFRAFCEPGKDNVITLPPTYGMYKVLAGINDIENREVLLTSAFEPNVKEILQNVSEHTKMIFLCSPNNPTGNSFSEENVLEILENFSGLVIIDEAYIDFSTRESWIKRLEEFNNLVITQTLSKAYGLAGIRLGICYASAEIITILNKIKPPYNVNELTQKRALKRIKNQKFVYAEVSDILEQRKQLLEALVEVNCIEEIYATDANFVLVKVDDAARRYNELLEKGIVIRNRTKEPLCENTLRITIGTAKENMELLEALHNLD